MSDSEKVSKNNFAFKFSKHQLGVVLIPKSSNKQRMKENIEIFDFALNDEEVALLETFDIGVKTTSPFSREGTTSNHKYCPTKIEF